MNGNKDAARSPKVSIQGYEGCFHQACGLSLFGPGVEVLPCATFGDVVRSVETREADAGVMAIENSIAGSIMPNTVCCRKGRSL